MRGLEHSVATYDLDIVFNGPCEGDCTDEALQLRGIRILHTALLLYALGLYPRHAARKTPQNWRGHQRQWGGHCGNLRPGIYAESVNVDSLATADDGKRLRTCVGCRTCDLVYDGDGDLIVATGHCQVLSEKDGACD